MKRKENIEFIREILKQESTTYPEICKLVEEFVYEMKGIEVTINPNIPCHPMIAHIAHTSAFEYFAKDKEVTEYEAISNDV